VENGCLLPTGRFQKILGRPGYTKHVTGMCLCIVNKATKPLSYSLTTITADEAAILLKMNKTSLMRKAKRGEIPGIKPGKRWVFVLEDLHEWMKGAYANMRQVSNFVDTSDKDTRKCHLRKEAKSGGQSSPLQTENEYESLLGLK
jgi:excisionase family DNA binding protein